LLLAGLDGAARRLRSVLPGCRPGLVHGDFAFGNALLQDDGRVAAVDWDLADTDLLVWDLARSIDLQTVSWPDDPSQPAQIQAALARAILQGYENVRPLSADERRALPVLMAASRVDLDASVLPIMVPMEPATAEPVLARQVVRLVRAAAGAPELAEALA
jgi:Ser/Thr protein kinase RdoA (MazF antagonist)